MTIEEWRPVAGYEGRYEISSQGKIKSLLRHNGSLWRILKETRGKNNYRSVNLWYKNSLKKVYVHRLVAKAFIPNHENKPDVNHIDNNPDNNNIFNLEWVTHKENMAHAVSQNRMAHNSGESSGTSILKETEVRKIRKSVLTQIKLSNLYGVSRECISAIKNYRTWKHIK